MTMVGASPSELYALSKKMDAEAMRLRGEVLLPLDQLIQGMTWQGPDAQRFRETWIQQRQDVLRVIETLEARARDLRKQADEQARASAPDVLDGFLGGLAAAVNKVIDFVQQVFDPVLQGESGQETGGVAAGHTAAGIAAVGAVPNLSVGAPQGIPSGADSTPNPAGAQQSHSFTSFAAKHEGGGPVEYNNDGYNYQCVDFVQAYAHHQFGVQAHVATGWGDARQMFANSSSAYYNKIDAGQTPQVGDIVCVGANGSNPYGHVAIVREVKADGSYSVIEQNGLGATDAARAPRVRSLSGPELNAVQGFLRAKPEKIVQP